MYELIQVSDRCFYFQSPAKIGLIKIGEDEAVLIDSGNDRDAGKKVRKHLDAKGWKLAAIYNTHSHADHIGGNHFLQEQTGCRIYAPGIERDLTEHPLLEPAFLYGGCPPGALRHKFLMAQPSEVLPLSKNVLPEGVGSFPLPGHSFDMVGFRADDVIFLADCMASRETLEKYKISFLVDVGAYLETLETVKTMKAALFIPSHAGPEEDISLLAQLNIDKTREIADRIEQICARPSSFEEILKELFDLYDLKISFEQHALIGSTVRSYLTYLTDAGRIRAGFDQNRLLFSA